jgi:hypothetical protein
MKVYPFRFNIYLTLIAALTLLPACHSDHDGKEDKQMSVLRVHIESNVDPAGTSQTVSVLRTDPVSFTVQKEPILTEANLLAARVLDAPAGSGFAVELKFDDLGTSILEQYTASNSGRHLLFFGQWGEKGTDGRWLAALLISHRMGEGVVSFTPDMSRDDVYRLVLGLNNMARTVQKGLMK